MNERKDLTPVHLKCAMQASCPSIHRLEDGRLHIIGAADGRTHDELKGDGFKIGPDEAAVIISEDLLAELKAEWARSISAV